MRILLVDDHAIVRRGLIQIVQDEFPDAVIDEAGSTEEALTKFPDQNWSAAVLDVSLPGRGGLELLKDLKEQKPDLPVLVLSMHPEDQYAVRALRAGASGYITKETAPNVLVDALKKVLAGGRYVSPSLAEKLAQRIGKQAGGLPHETLSDREYQVLKLIASGRTPTQIAESLSLSVKTVSTYRTRLLEKLGLHTSAEITHYAFQHKLVP